MTITNQFAFKESQYIYIRRLKNHPTYKKHSHNFLECLLVVKGYGIHIHNDSYDILLPGSCLIIHIGDTHEFIKTNNLEVVNIDLLEILTFFIYYAF